jgi:hypothetical protein
LVTSHECSYVSTEVAENASMTNGEGASALATKVATDRSKIDGGSVSASRIPRSSPDAWKSEPWLRTTVAACSKVTGQLGNMINPGAPEFFFTFPAKEGDSSIPPLWRWPDD